MTWIPPKSPYNLIQEQLWKDPWKIFVACIFCNLTKRVESEPYMWKFFTLYPSAEIASKASQCELQEMIQPLGLSERRSKALIRMSYEYNRLDWKTNPAALYGIGKYGSDAYRIFCKGAWREVEPKDGALINYKKYLSKLYLS